MANIFQYIKREYVNWLIALGVVFMYGIAQTADAQTSLKASAPGMSFYKDSKSGEWLIRYKNVSTAMDEDFAVVDVIWHQMVDDNPLVLIAGHQFGKCTKAYRLYWGQPTGDIRQAKFFDICSAKNIKVEVDENMVRINFDGKVKRIPLD